MTKTKKIKKGFMSKSRSLEEITKDYNTECFMAGHKQRLVVQWQEDVAKLKGEIDNHLTKALELNHEGMTVQKEQELMKQAEENKDSEVTAEDLARAADIQKAKELVASGKQI